jgi:hypothetical protein
VPLREVSIIEINRENGVYQFLYGSKIVLFHYCGRKWYTLYINLSGQYQVVPSFGYWRLRKIEEIFDFALFIFSGLESHFFELALSILLSLGSDVLERLISMDLHLF